MSLFARGVVWNVDIKAHKNRNASVMDTMDMHMMRAVQDAELLVGDRLDDIDNGNGSGINGVCLRLCLGTVMVLWSSAPSIHGR